MAVILMPEVAEFVKEDVVLQHGRKTYDIEVQVYVPFGRAAAPIGGVMLYCNTVVCEVITLCKFCKTRRQFRFGLFAQNVYFTCRRNRHILIFLFLTRDCIHDPVPPELEKGLCGSIRKYVWESHADPFDRMDTYAYATAPDAFTECHSPYFRIIVNLFPFHESY